MLASFQPARCNSEVFLDSLSNDVLLRGYNVGQKLLIGFGSNVDSTISISRSNMSMMKATVLASNMGIGTATPASNVLLHVAGNTRVEGNLIVNGTVTNINTDVRVTDQFTVCNDGTGPALVVTQLGAQPVVEFRDDNLVVFKVADGGFITIGSNNAATKLDVEGHTTVRGTIFTSNVVTSNVQTNSLTSVLMTNQTTITSNLFSSNLIINNQTIIGSNGVITNSNFLPPFNTSNVVAGQFTSNFFLNDNVVSSKLESNLVLKGTTTMSSNVFINNGDLRILGCNNFLNVGDQARVFLGSNDYFVGASKGVGLVFQVPGTTYPMVLENNSGFVGLGVMDPQENIHVGCNAKIDGNVYVMSNLAVGRSNPSRTVDIVGTTRISDTVTLLDDISIMSNNGAWSTQSGRQLYMRYSTNSGQDSAVIQSIDRSSGTFYNMGIEASNIAIGPINALSNPTIYAQYGGRVGIGTSNPEFNLHLHSNIADGVKIAIDNDNTAGWTEFNARNTSSGVNSGMRMGMIGTTFNQGGQFLRDAGFLECDGSNGLSIVASSNTGELRFYTGGATERVRIRASGNVGIGLSTPLEMLHVTGKIYTTQQHLGFDDIASVPSFSFRSWSNTGMFLANNASLGFSTKGFQRIHIDSNGLVGIGMSSPTYRVDVVGDIHTMASAFVAGTTAGFLRMLGSQSNTYIQSGLSNALNSAAPLIFSTINNGTEWARFDSNGNFGLGINRPSFKFDVSGQANITNPIANSASLSLSNNFSPYLEIKGSNTTLTIGVSGSNTFHSTNASIGDVVIKNSQDLATGRLLLQVGNGASALTINSNNTVGIGMTTPTTNLDVMGSIRATSNLYANGKVSFSNNSNMTGPSVGIEGSAGDRVILLRGDVSSHPMSIGVDSNALYHSVANGVQYVWYENGVARMSLSNGLLGLGTSNQTERIEVIGGKLYSDTQLLGPSNDSPTSPSFSFKEDSNTGIFHPSNDTLGITTAGTEKMRINHLGNVGIGTSNQTSKLHVYGDVNITHSNPASPSFSISNNLSPYAVITGSNSMLIMGASGSNQTHSASAVMGDVVIKNHQLVSSGKLHLQVGSTSSAITINSNNTVGIGTVNPLAPLTVSAKNTNGPDLNGIYVYNSNSTASSHSIITARVASASSGNAYTSYDVESVSGWSVGLDNSDNDKFKIINSWDFTTNPRFTIDSNGNVGVGTTSPTSRLHVNGDVLANSNIRSSVGTLGPSFTLVPENSFIDVAAGNQAVLNSLGEAGNPATGATRPLFYGSSFLYQDASGEDMKWNFARLIFRGCPLSATASTSVFTIQDFISSRTPQYSNLTSNFTLSNDGQGFGYVTYGTPWFGVSSSSARSLALNLVSNSTSSTFRVGQVQIQFRT